MNKDAYDTLTWSSQNKARGPCSVPACVHRKGPKQECPDYRTAGPNSCHFDSSHTTVWNVYCINVTAVTATKNYTSQQHCLDVADIGKDPTGSLEVNQLLLNVHVTRAVCGVNVSGAAFLRFYGNGRL